MQGFKQHCHKVFQGHFTYLNDGQSAGKQMSNSVVFNFRRNAGSDWMSHVYWL